MVTQNYLDPEKEIGIILGMLTLLLGITAYSVLPCDHDPAEA